MSLFSNSCPLFKSILLQTNVLRTDILNVFVLSCYDWYSTNILCERIYAVPLISICCDCIHTYELFSQILINMQGKFCIPYFFHLQKVLCIFWYLFTAINTVFDHRDTFVYWIKHRTVSFVPMNSCHVYLCYFKHCEFLKFTKQIGFWFQITIF